MKIYIDIFHIFFYLWSLQPSLLTYIHKKEYRICTYRPLAVYISFRVFCIVLTDHFFCDWQSNPDLLAKKWSKIRSRSDRKQPWKKGLAIKSRFPITITFLLKFRKFLWFLLQDVEVQDFSCTYYDNLYVLT